MGMLHFAPDDEDVAACGVHVYTFDQFTDEPKFVECKRCLRTRKLIDYDPRRFNVDVWNHEGEVIAWEKGVTIEVAEAIQDQYADDPTVDVVVADTGQ